MPLAATLDELIAGGHNNPLRIPQLGALETIRGYLAANSPGAALIHMPTGSGKTGIIALTARALTGHGCAVVVCPRSAIRDQLASDIHRGFLTTIGHPDALPIDGVTTLLPTTAVTTDFTPGHVYVLTTHALTQLRNRHPATYDQLSAATSLVIFDEGHYEPSPTWSRAIRDLKAPTVLTSATPYRNDVRFFNIDVNHIYSYRYADAVHHGYLRTVRWHHDLVDPTATAPQFATAIHNYVTSKRLQQHSRVPEAKVMIRCETHEAVRDLTDALLELAPADVVGVHERFANTPEPHLYARTPDVRTHPARYWVHQYKLLEGVDQPRFALIALYDPPTNARSVVQQIGRALRTVDNDNSEQAQIITRGPTQAQRQWNAYLEFDQADDAIRQSIGLWQDPDQSEATANLTNLIDPKEKWLYSLGDFRTGLDPEQLDPYEDLLIRASTLALTRLPGLSASRLRLETRFCEGRNRIILNTWQPDDDTDIVLWISFEDSPILRGYHFADRTLGYTISRIRPDMVFYADSEGWTPKELRDKTRPLRRSEMERLIPVDATTRLVEVNLANTDIGSHAVRSKTLRAFDLVTSAVALNDHAHAPSAARLRVPRVERTPDRDKKPALERYLGLTRGRITDRGRTKTLKHYLVWLTEIESHITYDTASPPAMLHRYATESTTPDDTSPRNILLDIDDLRDTWAAELADVTVDDACSNIDHGIAQTVIDGEPITYRVTYHANADEYHLTHATGRLDPNLRLFERLTSEQAFRVVPASHTHLYAYQAWYRPTVGSHTDNNSFWRPFLDLFHPIVDLEHAHSEKGRAATNSKQAEPTRGRAGWHKDSVFHHIDKPNSLISPKDVWNGLLCDDGGANEIADFIAYSSKTNTVAFAHAKATATPKPRSASALAEVTSQAAKNLRHLSPYDTTDPPNKARVWDKDWSIAGIGATQRLRRRPSDVTNPHQFWDRVRDALANPITVREVWVVVGGGFSKAQLQNRLANDQLTSEDVQLFYQVTTTWSAVSAAGARLKIYCSP